jgi:hypothetical protein
MASAFGVGGSAALPVGRNLVREVLEVATDELQRDGLERITVEQLATMCAVEGF